MPKEKGKAQKDFKPWAGVIPSMLFRRIAPAMVQERGRQSGYMWEQGLGLEMSVVVSLRRDGNDLWQRSGDREAVTHFQRGACVLAIVRLDVEDKGGDGQSESQDAPHVTRCMVMPFGEGRKRFIEKVEQN